MENMEDKRSRRTKKLIKDCFLKLAEKNHRNIPMVSELCEKADINRSTFYFYYQDIRALLEELENEFLNEVPFVSFRGNDAQILKQYKDYTSFIRNNSLAFCILYENGFLKQKVVERSEEYVGLQNLKDREKIMVSKMYIHYIAVGHLEAIYWWLTKAPSITNDQAAKMLCDITKKIDS